MLKRMAVGFVVMVLVVGAVGVGLMTASRMRAPSAEQQAALELLKQVPAEGSNAYAALLLMPYDVPEAEVEALARAEAERFSRMPVMAGNYRLEVPHARVVTDVSKTGYCSWNDDNCLEKVRANRDVIALRLGQQQALLQRIEMLSRHGHYRSLMEARLDAPVPGIQVLNAAITSHALQYIDGDVDSALAGVCGQVRTWRTLAPNADSLMASMMGARIIEGSTRLLAQMLEPLPANHPLPPVCAVAFAAPAPGELSLCEAMRGEARMSRSFRERHSLETAKGSRLQRAGQGVFYDQAMTDARMALHFAHPCSAEAQEQIRRDVPVTPVQRPREQAPWGLDCAGNAVGCILADIAAPTYVDYPLRLQDAGMALRAMGTLLWIRERRAAGDTRTVEELVAQQPDGLASASRPVQVVEGGSVLQVARFNERQGKFLRLPLPVGTRESALPTVRVP